MATGKKKGVKIAHYGPCPDGYIRDHDVNHDTYGKCIPIVKTAKKGGKSKGMKGWLA